MIDPTFIKGLLEETAGRTIVAATKYVGVPEIRELLKLGIDNIGENRVDAFLEKKDALGAEPITWHFIGHLQSKKVKKMINEIDVLHSLDRGSLAEAIQKYRTTPLDCFIEVNISGETTKSGLNPESVIDFCENIKKYDKIHIVGLMGMAELTNDMSLVEQQFMTLVDLQKTLKEKTDLHPAYLSMGMSNDYRVAMKCGATHLRLGSILF